MHEAPEVEPENAHSRRVRREDHTALALVSRCSKHCPQKAPPQEALDCLALGSSNEEIM